MKGSLQNISDLTKTQLFVLQHYLSSPTVPNCYHTIWFAHLKIRNLSLPLFFKSVKSVTERHPVLKTVFLLSNDNPVQQATNPNIALNINYDDISSMSRDDQDRWIEDFQLRDWNIPFNVHDSSQPLFRTYIVKRSNNDIQFVVSFHHAILDGWSIAILVKEILDHYQKLKAEATLSLAAANYDYADVIKFENKILWSKDAKDFWSSHLKHHQEFMPCQIERRKNVGAYRPVSQVLSPELSTKATMLSRKFGIPLKQFFLGLFLRMLQTETEQSYTTVGVIMNGRGMELKNPLSTLGLCWKIAPLCIETIADDARFFKTMNEKLAEVAAHASYPLLSIMAEKKTSQLFHAAFNFLNYEGASIVPANSGIDFIDVGILDKFHCSLHLLVGKNHFNQTISLVFNYDTRYYSEAQVQEKLSYFVKELTRRG